MGDGVPLEGALVVEVEVFQGLASREPGGPDPDLATVGLAGGHLPLQTGGQELLVGPALRAGPLAQPLDGGRQGRGLQHPTEVGKISVGFGGGAGHHATPVARS